MLVFGQDEAVARWVADRIPFVRERGFGANKAIGIADRNGTPLAGVVYHDWAPEFGTLSFSIAADTPRWATKRTVALLLHYPFEDVGAQKIWTITPAKNERALRLLKGLKFTRESIMGRQFGLNEHGIINRMYRENYDLLYRELAHGRQTNTTDTT